MLLCMADVSGLVPGPWSDRELPPEERAQALRKAMTLEEKLLLFHGPPAGGQCRDRPECAYVGNVAPVPRLGIPPINMQDGPQGFRNKINEATSTAWPSGMAMAATWDEAAVFSWGANMGREFHAKGANVQLGPGVCLARVPLNGRNFEYLSGEDPYLGYRLAQPAVRGIQSQKVVANAKHWVLNNQETNRQGVSAEADERTRFEMYYPPFEGAIEAGVGSYMCGYNKINGEWSCENPTTLSDLKRTLGFKGYVMSDWGATHSTSLGQGLDMEMPHEDFMNASAINAQLGAGILNMSAVDDAVDRILWSMFSVGVMDEPKETWDWKNLGINVTTPASMAAARHLSALSTVLLKNEGGALPLEESGTIALFGFVDEGAIFGGDGSGRVVPSKAVSPAEGVREAVGNRAKVLVDAGTDIPKAAVLAKTADRAVVFVGTLSTEGHDRESLSLDVGCESKNLASQCSGNAHEQNKLIEAIAEANPRTIVVASVPGAVLMPWADKVAGILTNFMPGQEAGNAIADVLFGKVNPSAKLPITMPNVANELNFSQAQWPGVPSRTMPEKVFYFEKLLVGYRYYDAHDIKFTTGFPFGHGLSYTSFSYSDLAMQGQVLSFSVKNDGPVAGAEVAQLYLGFPNDAGEPLKQLKGFNKTRILGPGEIAPVSMFLRARDMSYWSSQTHRWVMSVGTYQVFVGSSSRDIRLHGSFQVGPSGEIAHFLNAEARETTLVV